MVRDPDAVRDVLHRPADFSPANALVAVTPLEGPALRVLQRVGFALPPVLASNDTGTHGGIRKVVAGFFTPATVAAMEPRIRELAREAAGNAADQLDSVRPRGPRADGGGVSPGGRDAGTPRAARAGSCGPQALGTGLHGTVLGLARRGPAARAGPQRRRVLRLAAPARGRIRGGSRTQPVQVPGRAWPVQDRRCARLATSC